MIPRTKQLALIYKVYYKCIKTNLNVQALNKKTKGETTFIQTTTPRSQIQIPKTLKWTEISFPQDWTLQNENYSFQIQHPSHTPDLDFVQQLTDGTVRLSFDQSRFRFPLDLHQPKMQSPMLLKDRSGSQCSSSRPPPHTKNLDSKLQGVKTRSQISTPCYTTKQESVADKDENHSQSFLTQSDFEQAEPLIGH